LFNLYTECGSPVFDLIIGSRLIGVNSKDSDYDKLSICKTRVGIQTDLGFMKNIQPSFDYLHESSIEEKSKLYDTVSISFVKLIRHLTSIDELHVTHANSIMQHLYAIKSKSNTSIYNQDIYQLYMHWLHSPGFAQKFWETQRNINYKLITSLPDKSFNWSQDYDGSEQQQTAKNTWERDLIKPNYPVVDKILGYDLVESRHAFTQLILGSTILSDNNQVADIDIDFLLKLRQRKIGFKEYTLYKKDLWNRFRTATESMHSRYFLGNGYTLKQSKETKVYGYTGLKYLIDSIIEE